MLWRARAGAALVAVLLLLLLLPPLVHGGGFYSYSEAVAYVAENGGSTGGGVVLPGDLKISNVDDITDLTALSGLIEVQGYLFIRWCDALMSLAGLEQLQNIDGYLNIEDNPLLTDISALSLLTEVPDYLQVWNCAALESLHGLEGIVSVGANLRISENPLLSSLLPLSGIISLGGDLLLSENRLLSSLSSLSGINSVGGRLYVEDCDVLESLYGLHNVASIEEELWVKFNDRLVHLRLDSLNTVGTYVDVTDNPLLCCDADNLVSQLGGSGHPSNDVECGGSDAEYDSDSDGEENCLDACPFSAMGDTDSDGWCDSIDACTDDPLKGASEGCGCGIVDNDADSDGVLDCIDACPDDPAKSFSAGVCGCGEADSGDADNDGVPDCVDACPLSATDDTDSDGWCDNVDACPDDPLKGDSEGVCGCGIADGDDADNDSSNACNIAASGGNTKSNSSAAVIGGVTGAIACVCCLLLTGGVLRHLSTDFYPEPGLGESSTVPKDGVELATMGSAELYASTQSYGEDVVGGGRSQNLNIDEVPTFHSIIEPYLMGNLAHITVGELLGSGSFGNVYSTPQGIKRKGGKKKNIVLKEIGTRLELLEEMQSLVNLKHPNIVRLYGIACVKDELEGGGEISAVQLDGGGAFTGSAKGYYLVMELANRGSLKDVLKKHGQALIMYRGALARADSAAAAEHAKSVLTPRQLTQLCLQACVGMSYLAREKLVHCDLASRNLLVDDQRGSLVCKVADFGLSSQIHNQNKTYQRMTGKALPVRWAAPEVIREHKYSEKSDVFSMGVVLWEMFSGGSRPFLAKRNREVSKFVVGGGRLSKPADCPDEVYALMRDCFKESPAERPTFAQMAARLYGVHERLEAGMGSYGTAATTTAVAVDGGMSVHEVTYKDVSSYIDHDYYNPEDLKQQTKISREKTEDPAAAAPVPTNLDEYLGEDGNDSAYYNPEDIQKKKTPRAKKAAKKKAAAKRRGKNKIVVIGESLDEYLGEDDSGCSDSAYDNPQDIQQRTGTHAQAAAAADVSIRNVEARRAALRLPTYDDNFDDFVPV